jgi:hypothetical protein
MQAILALDKQLRHMGWEPWLAWPVSQALINRLCVQDPMFLSMFQLKQYDPNIILRSIKKHDITINF